MAFVKEEPTLQNEISAMALFGHNVYEKHPMLGKIAKKLEVYREPIGLSALFSSLLFSPKLFKEAEETLQQVKVQFSKDNLRKFRSSSDLLDLFKQGEKYFTDLLRIHMMASQYSSICQMFAFSFMAKGSKKLSVQHKNDIATILGEAKNFESATIPAMINDISRAIFVSKKSEEFCSIESENCVKWMEENCVEALKLYRAFINQHGHRGLNELEISSKPWSEKPEQVFEMIAANLKFNQTINEFNRPATTEFSVQELFKKIKTPMTFTTKLILRFLLPRCIKGVEYRETAKSLWVSSFNEMRRSIHYMGRMMVNEGLLPDPNLVFHLTVPENYQLMKNRDGRLVAKAIRRQKLFEQWKKIKFPEISFGIPRREVFEKSTVVSEGNILVRGSPVCNGSVTARACVCKSFADVHKIQKGDILITYGTDIGWSPYFPILDGIVTEIGGLISHGAVVAREYGLPSVIAAANATDLIEHGQMIILNANDGIVMKAEK